MIFHTISLNRKDAKILLKSFRLWEEQKLPRLDKILLVVFPSDPNGRKKDDLTQVVIGHKEKDLFDFEYHNGE